MIPWKNVTLSVYDESCLNLTTLVQVMQSTAWKKKELRGIQQANFSW